METIDCPDGDTRTEKEIIVKLIVAHFTAIVAFCNFQSLRNERLDTIEPILFLLSPLMVITQTGLGLVIITISFLFDLALSPKLFRDHLATYSRRWTTLFGSKSTDSSQPRVRSRLGRAWIRLGRTVAIFATLFQFAATIFLYRRRGELHGWEALTTVDHRTFELSVGGATVSILSLALLLKFPGFGQAPETLYTSKLETDTAILFCRGDSRRCPSWYQILYATDIGSATSAATWLACVSSSTYKGESLPLSYASRIYSGIYSDVSDTLSLDVSMPTFYLLVAITFAAFSSFSHISKGLDFKRLGNSLWLMAPALLILIVVMVAYMCMVLLMVVPICLYLIPSVLSGPGCIFTMKGLEIRDVFSQPPFGVSTNGTDCLLLWKDPVADYLWSLV